MMVEAKGNYAGVLSFEPSRSENSADWLDQCQPRSSPQLGRPMSFSIYVSTMNDDDENMFDRAGVERAFRDIAVDQTGGYWNLRSPDGRIASTTIFIKDKPTISGFSANRPPSYSRFPNTGMRYSRYCLRHVPFCFGRREVRDRTVESQMAHYCLISQANGLTRWANPRSSRLVLRLKRPSRLPATSPVHLNHAPHSPKPCLPTPDIPRRRLDTTHSRSTPRTNGESWITVPLAWGWRKEWDSNPRYGFPYTRFPSERLQPLGHPSGSRKRAQYSGRVLSYNPRKQDPATGTNRRPRMKSAHNPGVELSSGLTVIPQSY